MATQATPDKHKDFDFETQVQLDRLYLSWAQHDRAGNYFNEAFNARNDELLQQYDDALEAAYRTLASAEADEFIKRHKSALVALVSQWGYWQLSKQLTAQVREAAQ